MRRARRAVFVTALAAAAVACGLGVTGIAPDQPAPADASTDQTVALQDTRPVIGDREEAPDTGPPPCDAGGGFCDYCDPTLVLCIQFEGGVADQSMYARDVEVVGTPAFVAANGGAISLDGSVQITVPGDPELAPTDEATLEVILRMRVQPPDGGRYGLFDRNGGPSIFIYGDGRLSCHGLTQVVSPFDGGAGAPFFASLTCVVTKGQRAQLYTAGIPLFDLDSGVLAGDAGGPMAIGRNEKPADSDASDDHFQGEISSIRLYTRALTAKDIARLHGRDAGP